MKKVQHRNQTHLWVSNGRPFKRIMRCSNTLLYNIINWIAINIYNYMYLLILCYVTIIISYTLWFPFLYQLKGPGVYNYIKLMPKIILSWWASYFAVNYNVITLQINNVQYVFARCSSTYGFSRICCKYKGIWWSTCVVVWRSGDLYLQVGTADLANIPYNCLQCFSKIQPRPKCQFHCLEWVRNISGFICYCSRNADQ